MGDIGAEEKQTSAMGGQNDGQGQRQGMLAVNDLTYVLSPDLSVSVNNTYKNHFFQSQEYTDSQKAICILNSGADYGDMRSSTLNFTVEITTNDAATTLGYFGAHGSAVNLIKTITLSSRSGDEVCRINDLNHLTVATMALRYNENWMKTVGQTMGLGATLRDSTVAGLVGEGAATTHNAYRFSIPLYILSDFFGYGRLMPAMMLAGMRIEIEWADPKLAFQAIDADGNASVNDLDEVENYRVKNLYVSMRSVQLTDGTQRALNEMSAVNGLEIVYCDYDKTERELNNSDSEHLEVRKSASRALKAIVTTRPKISTTPAIKDSFASEKFGYAWWQWQLGALYFPQQPVKAKDKSKPYTIIPETYQHALNCFHTYKNDANRCSALPMRSIGDPTTYVGASGRPIRLTGTASMGGTTAIAGQNGSRFTFELSKGDSIFIGNKGPFIVDSITNDTAAVATTTGTAAQSTSHVIPFRVENNTDFTITNPWTEYGNARYGTVANNDGRWGTFANGRTTVCCLLERSDLFNLTGVPINNSRVLSFQCEYSTPADRTVTIYLKYVRLARIFLNNVEVEQ